MDLTAQFSCLASLTPILCNGVICREGGTSGKMSLRKQRYDVEGCPKSGSKMVSFLHKVLFQPVFPGSSWYWSRQTESLCHQEGKGREPNLFWKSSLIFFPPENLSLISALNSFDSSSNSWALFSF